MMAAVLKLLRCLMPFATASWLAVTGVLGYWQFLDHPIPVRIQKIALIPDVPHHAGDVITLHVDVCQSRPGVPGTGIRMIIGPLPPNKVRSSTYFLPGNYIDPLIDCTQHERPIELLHDMVPGNYNYVFQGIYQINPIKTEVFTQPPIGFEIIQ
jgi:hypothetical protein